MNNLKSEVKITEDLASMVKRLGTPESTLLLQSPCHVFTLPRVDGVIGYHLVGKCAVAIGDPICLPEDRDGLVQGFHSYCEAKGFKLVYLMVHHDFAHFAVAHGCKILIRTGSELSINPTQFQKKQKLRWKINQSVKNGVQVKEYKDFDLSLENRIKQTIATWSKERSGPQIFLGSLDIFNQDGDKRIFYAEQNNQVIGVLVLLPIDRFHGWVISTYLALSDAPVGTTEHLMDSVFSALANENCHFLCLGAYLDTVSKKHLNESIGLGFFNKMISLLILKMASWFFKLDKKMNYLNKYHPHLRPTFLILKDKLTITELIALKNILNVKI